MSPSFLRRLAIASILLVCSAAIALGLYKTRPVHTARPGDPFPDLTVATMDGRIEALSLPANGVYVVNVFATWCGPCREEMPAYARAASDFAAAGIETIGIAQGNSLAQVVAFRREFGIQYPLMIDTASATRRLLGARIVPETLVVRNGIIASATEGPLTESALRELAFTR